MISHRQADIIDRVRNDQNPIGKKFMLAPGGYKSDDVIVAVDGRRVTLRDSKGRETTDDRQEFLGCRDGYAFYKENVADLMRMRVAFKESPHDEQGKIVSLDKGIITTENGKKFKAEEWPVWSYVNGRVLLYHDIVS